MSIELNKPSKKVIGFLAIPWVWWLLVTPLFNVGNQQVFGVPVMFLAAVFGVILGSISITLAYREEKRRGLYG